MTDTLERCARARHNEWVKEWEALGNNENLPMWEELPAAAKEASLRCEAAAIEALMEPDETMLETFYREMERGHLPDSFEPVFARAWQAALRSVLGGDE